jgi:AraC-like DNA-binding protein
MYKENRTTISQDFPLEVLPQAADGPRVWSDPHWHELVEILFNLEGEFHLQLGETAIHMQPGDICLINQFGIHSTRALTKTRNYIIFFDPRLLINTKSMYEDERLTEEILCGDRCYYIPADNSPQAYLHMRSALLRLIDAYGAEIKGSMLFAKANLFTFLGHLIQYPNVAQSIVNPNQRRQRERLDAILDFLDKNFSAKITLHQMAKSINVSPYRFCHIFRELTGISFSHYLLNFRIYKAQEMLLQETKSITEIALSCGFNNVSYFNHVFRRITGCSPGQYRKKSKIS